MFEHYLSNKNERATVAPKSKFCKLNKGIVAHMYVRYYVTLSRITFYGTLPAQE